MKKAAYDNYDYPAYWEGRDYEHESEVVTLKDFLSKIPKIKSLMDLGCGYGRLAPYYIYRANKVVLADPSSTLLETAREKLKKMKNIVPQKLKNISFVQTSVEDVKKTFPKRQFDVVVMVRVMHHLTDPEKTFEALSSLIRPGGYLILEFANKIHGKAMFQNLIHGNFTFPIDITPSSRKTNNKKGTIAFLNYHPDLINEMLSKHGFKVLEKRSVSNIRSPFVKKHIPISALISLEEMLQKPLSKFSFGPSIFVLARKRG